MVRSKANRHVEDAAMPSPFPGMNPYFEAIGLWPGVHLRLVEGIGTAINGAAPERYFADVEERVYLCDTDDLFTQQIIPDVSVRETDPPETIGSPSTTAATLTAPVRLRMTVPNQITEHRVVIRSLDDQRIVTVIEVLSPANKSTGSAGRESYIAKRNEILASGTHFVEIDLLRGGKRIPRVEHLPDSDYLICVSRDHQRPYADWWPLMLEQTLPEIPVPLRREDPDITIDVQAILHELYDRGGYTRRLDYSQPAPSPALSQTRQQWIEETVL